MRELVGLLVGEGFPAGPGNRHEPRFAVPSQPAEFVAREEEVRVGVGEERDDLGVPEVTSHSFRKTIATLIDDQGLSARIGADQLGHSNVSMTQDRYMKRGRVHQQVADLMDRTVDINDE